MLVIGGSVLIGLCIYFGFVYKFKDGFTGWQKITTGKMTREEANKILPKAPASYDDDFVITWAKAVKNNTEYFIVRDKKYSTTSGKAI